MALDFSNKKVLVSGGTRGIGRDIVDNLLSLNAQVFVISKSEENLKNLKTECPLVQTVCADVSKVEEMKKAVAPFLPFHCLVNNAGISKLESFLEITEEAFNDVMSVNLNGAVFLSQIVARGMIQGGIKGSIVLVSSVASTKPFQDHAAYCSSKAALDGVMKVMALELGPHGIRVNCVNPTVVMTEMGKKAWGDPAKSKPLLDRIFLGHFAEPQDVSSVVSWLLSDQAAMISGTAIPIDGGFCAS